MCSRRNWHLLQLIVYRLSLYEAPIRTQSVLLSIRPSIPAARMKRPRKPISPTLFRHFIASEYLDRSTLKSLWWLFVCFTVWLHHTWINWFVSLICPAIGAYVRQHYSYCKSRHSAHRLANCWPSFVSKRCSLHPLSGTPYHWKSSH